MCESENYQNSSHKTRGVWLTVFMWVPVLGGKWEGEVYEGFSWTRAVNTTVYSCPWTPCVPVVKGGGCNERWHHVNWCIRRPRRAQSYSEWVPWPPSLISAPAPPRCSHVFYNSYENPQNTFFTHKKGYVSRTLVEENKSLANLILWQMVWYIYLQYIQLERVTQWQALWGTSRSPTPIIFELE